MAVVFLIGGKGNQLTQFASSAPEDTFSTLFLSRSVCALMGWQVHPKLFQLPKPGVVTQVMAIVLLLIDIVRIRLGKAPRHVEFKLISIHASPERKPRATIGYAFGKPFQRSVAPLYEQLRQKHQGEPPCIAVHIRGGDMLRQSADGWNGYGRLRPMYFQRAVQKGLSLRPESKTVRVFTDDLEHAQMVWRQTNLASKPVFDCGALEEMLAACLVADVFVASNSSLSWWIVVLRGEGKISLAPRPFTRARFLTTPECAIPLNVKLD